MLNEYNSFRVRAKAVSKPVQMERVGEKLDASVSRTRTEFTAPKTFRVGGTSYALDSNGEADVHEFYYNAFKNSVYFDIIREVSVEKAPSKKASKE